MLKKIGLAVALLFAIFVLVSPPQAKAGVSVGISVGPVYSHPAYPYAVDPYAYSYQYAYPYAYSPYVYSYGYPSAVYVYPYGGRHYQRRGYYRPYRDRGYRDHDDRG